MSSGNSPSPTRRRLDQWLWFARFAKSRSLASRLCAAGAITINGVTVTKANHPTRVGDIIVIPQGAFLRTIQVKELGVRRGPSMEARLLYEEKSDPVQISQLDAAWQPLLAHD